MAKKPQGASTVTYCSDRFGYRVQIIKNGELVEEYSAGNCRGDSQEVVSPESRAAVSPQQLKAWARKTALEYAEEYNIPATAVAYDYDLAEALREEREALC